MFPDYNSPDLHLAHPTREEKLATWNLNYEEWGKALSKSEYLHREQYLASVPLTSDDGMTYWCLVDKNAPPNSREIYASCESLRKRAFISRKGKVEEVIIHSIGSVFCPPKNRGHRYASRMMKDLGSILRTWQIDSNIPGRSQIPASILFSDIGKKFYANHGWLPFPSSHIALPPISKNTKALETSLASPLKAENIPALCNLDVQYIRRVLERASDDKTHIALLPDHATIQWHHLRENIMSTPIFGYAPEIKGAIAGSDLGSRVWAYWTRGYYNPIDFPNSSNCLHILRLVIEDEVDNEENARKLESVLRYAQMEAQEWKMKDVQFWNPTPLVEKLLDRSDLGGEGAHERVEREEESVASLMWYGEGGGSVNELEWVGNEKYGWC